MTTASAPSALRSAFICTLRLFSSTTRPGHTRSISWGGNFAWGDALVVQQAAPGLPVALRIAFDAAVAAVGAQL